jgi:hypothetical protein
MTQREQLQREIASILDHPSVYMGGPSARNMALAERIMRHLEKSTTNLLVEVERLRAERAGDQQRLFHYEGAISDQRAEIERLRARDGK